MEYLLKKRDSNFELLRIIAMFMIVSYHYMAHGVRHIMSPKMSVEWLSASFFKRIFVCFFSPGGTIGVGIFFFLTGYFMYALQNNSGGGYSVRRLFKLILQVYFYSIMPFCTWLICRLFGLYTFPEITSLNQIMLFINTIIPITSGNGWWFTQTYFIIFLFIPVINEYLQKLSNKQMILTLSFVWLFWYSSTIFPFAYKSFQKALFFYILGATIRQCPIKINKWISLFLFVVTWGFYVVLEYYDSAIIKNESIRDMFVKNIYDALKNIVLVPGAVVSIVLFFEKTKIPYNRIINEIASTTFGIYLFHDSIIGRQLIWNKIFHVLDVQYVQKYFQVNAISTILFVFIIGSGIDFVRKTIFERKCLFYMNKLVDKFMNLKDKK